MNPNIQSLLNELYAADASLKQHESTLVSLIERMLESRPNVKIDARFRAELRTKLLESIAERDQHSALSASRRFVWAFGGAIILILVAIPVVYTSLTKEPRSGKRTDSLGSWGITKRLSAGAFGVLSPESVRIAESGERGGNSDATSAGLGGNTATTPSDIKPVPIEYSANEYAYLGEPLELASGQVTVYKREAGFTNLEGTGQLLRNVKTNLIDLSAFSSLELGSLSFQENKDNGYLFSFDLNYGLISIYENWSRWPTLVQMEKDGYAPLTADEALSDAESIALANSFLDDYGVSRSLFGAPVVQQYPQYLTGTRAVEDANGTVTNSAPVEDLYIPDSATVIYPLKIDGKLVYDLSGNPYGLNVRVNFRARRVAGLDNLRSMNLATSAYEAVSDATAVLDVVKRGGVYGGTIEGATTINTYETGTPEQVLVAMQSYSTNSADEFFVPALRFPITKTPAGTFEYQTAIVVPLVADFLETAAPDGGVRILPADNVNGSGSSSGSAGAAVNSSTVDLSEPVESPTVIVNVNR